MPPSARSATRDKNDVQGAADFFWNMDVCLNANMCDAETEPLARILRHAFKTIEKDLSKDYGGSMQHLWIDFELIRSLQQRRSPFPFRFQKRVAGSGFKKLTGLPTTTYENVGHYSVKPDFQKLLRIPPDAVASYALGLIYASTSALIKKQKRLGGFDVHRFRQDFLTSCREHGFQIDLCDAMS